MLTITIYGKRYLTFLLRSQIIQITNYTSIDRLIAGVIAVPPSRHREFLLSVPMEVVHHGVADKRITNLGSNWTPAPIIKETLVGLIAGREIRIRIVRAYVFTLPRRAYLFPIASFQSVGGEPAYVYPHFPRFPIALRF